MTLNEWAQTWNIPIEAIDDLRRRLGHFPDSVPRGGTDPEAVEQQQIRLEAPKRGVMLCRNNNGACYDQDGRLIRYGLANDSKAMSKRIKSADLIGITPIIIQPSHIGFRLGVFTSIEVKRPGWKFKGTEREQAQNKWAELVISLGGFAQFATGPGDIWHD